MFGSRKRHYRPALVVAMVAAVVSPHPSASCFATLSVGACNHGGLLARYESGGTIERRDEPGHASEPLCCVAATKSIVSIPSRPAASTIWVAIAISYSVRTDSPTAAAVRALNQSPVHDPPAYLQHERLLI